ncbi:MAG: hypothetical protein J7539_10540 [Niabella sp.]|nr:hypothetical protein [Niabella sp.]
MKLILLAFVLLGFGAIRANAQHYRYERNYHHRYYRPHRPAVSVVYYPTYRPYYYHRHYRPRYYDNYYSYRYRHMPPGQAKKYYGYRSGRDFAPGHNRYRD